MDSLWANSARSFTARRLLCLLPVAGCLLATGCNNGKQMQYDLYQRELRLQEDEIYRLEDYIDEYQAIIQNYRCELAEVRRELADRKPSAKPTEAVPAPHDAEPLPAPTPADSDPVIEEPVIEEPIEIGSTPDIEAATPSAGEAIDAPTEAPAFGGSGDEAPGFEPAPLFDGGSGQRGAPAEHQLTALEEGNEPALLVTPASTSTSTPPMPYPHAVAAAVAPIRLDEQLTLSARNLDGEAATLIVLLTEAAPAALAGFEGEASVMLTEDDPTGRMQRIARWDFTPGEVLHAWRTNPDAHGTAIELPITLPSEAPIDRRLQLWVRLVDREGKKRMQATPVWLAGAPLRLDAARTGIAASPLRRLPATEELDHQPGEFLLADEARPLSEWRAAVDTPNRRRVDPALQTASFEETPID